MPLTAYKFKDGPLGLYFDRHPSNAVTIDYPQITRWTQFSMWRDNREFLVAHTETDSFVVVQVDNPDEKKTLAKISRQFRHKHRLKIGFVRNDLTTNLTDALAAVTPCDLDVYYRLEYDIEQARTAARKLAKHPSDQVKVEMPRYDAYPAESLDRLMKCEFVMRWYEPGTVGMAHYGHWNPKTAKLTKCSCMREEGVIKTPSGSCKEHGYLVG